MSLFMTLNTGASGLGASSLGLAVIGDNIANLGTTGFKSSAPTFADLIPQNIGTLSGASQVGMGSISNSVSTYFSQGSISGTSSALDVAVSGSGFFQVTDGTTDYYTRDGSFFLDSDDYLVNSSGLRVQGYQAEDGTLSSLVSDIQVSAGPLPQQVTSTVELHAELAPQDDLTPQFPAVATLDGTSASSLTIEELAELSDFSTSVTIYDSLGQPHDATILFEQTGTNSWDWMAVVDGAEDGLDSGFALALSSGSLGFDADGNLDPATFTELVNATPTFGGADPFSFMLDVGSTSGGALGLGEITQAGTESSVSAISQDGYGTGQLLSVYVDETGTILGQYDNGEELIMGQLALAMFPSETGLSRVGGNLFQDTLASGEPAMGVAGTGGRGSTIGYALEGSNVELEDEFVAMIETQRSYQANAGVIRTADETLQELVNLV